jgi:hypothetical protein
MCAALVSGASVGAGAAPREPRFSRYRFYSIVPNSGSSVLVIDFDRDGRRDVLMGARDEEGDQTGTFVFMYRQLRNGTLGDRRQIHLPLGSADHRLSAGHLNDDRFRDVAIPTRHGLFVMYGRKNRLAWPKRIMARSVQRVSIRDMDRDGRDDIVASTWDGVPVMRQTRRGAFRLWTWVDDQPLANLETGDVNGDGRPDVIGCEGYRHLGAGCSRFRLDVFTQGRNGTFWMRRYKTPEDLFDSVEVAEVTGDRRKDVIVSNGAHRPAAALYIFRQTRAGRLVGPRVLEAYDLPEPITTGDVNGDGRRDIVTVHGGWDAYGIFLMKRSGRYAPELLAPVPTSESTQYEDSVAVGDVTGDRRADIVVADRTGLVVLESRRRR